MLTRKCIVPNDIIETVLKPVVLASLHADKKSCKDAGLFVDIMGEKINPASDRYKVFFALGTRCIACGLEGTIWAMEKHGGAERYHLNLYGLDKDGKEVLLTKDHIIPKKHGGPNLLSNYQVLCKPCNYNKDYVPPAGIRFNDTQIPEQYLVFRPATGPKCPFCNCVSVLADAKVIYGDESDYGMVYVCPNYPKCDSYVGCKKGTATPLGSLANSALHALRIQAHSMFDNLTWKTGLMTRDEAYKRLQEVLQVKKENCHIGMFTMQQCNRIINLCNSGRIIPPNLRKEIENGKAAN